jgi:iron complex transport system ATP-binding protein
VTLVCHNVSFAYAKGAAALRDISVELPDGVLAIIGTNGAGKSTLLRVLGGVARPSGGSVELDGKPLTTMRPVERARRIALVAQRGVVSGALSVREVVALGRFAVGHDQQAVDRALGRTNLAEHQKRPFHTLSVGQQQRVSIARALAQLGYPRDLAGKVLLADEPTSALDPAQAGESQSLIRELAQAGVRVCLATHDLTLAQVVSGRVVALDQGGRIAFEGPTAKAMKPDNLSALFVTGFTTVSLGDRPIAMPSATAI